MATPQIRRLSPVDAAAYRALMLEAYASSPEAFTSTVAERESLPPAWWTARLSEEPGTDSLACGALVDGELIGAAALLFEQRERASHKATLVGMYVQPKCRGAGVGAALVQEILRQAALAPHTEIVQLTVTESNHAAIRLYSACGFVPFGAEPFAVRLGSEFLTKLHMWRRVERGAT